MMKEDFVYSRTLNEENFKESFSNLNIIYELMVLSRDKVEFHSEIKSVIQSKLLEEIQLRMLGAPGQSHFFDYKTTQELPIVINAVNDIFQLSMDYYDFKIKMEASIQAVILSLNKFK